MSDYIPPELIIQILLKLPTKSIIRFTTVCKSWRCIITSSFFISSYLYKPKNQTKLLLRRYDECDEQVRYSLLEVAEHKPFTIISSSEIELPFEPRFSNLEIVGSCRGIICLSDPCIATESIVLWNPCLRKHLVLPKGTIDLKKSFGSELGFGFVDHDFKVVRLLYCYDSRLNYLPEAEVFSLRTGRWRRLGVDVRLQNVAFAYTPQFFVNGGVHWLAHNAAGINTILVFCVSRETFDEIKLPNELKMEDTTNLSLASIGESLAVIQYNDEFGVLSCDVWLMQEYGNETSWTKWYIFLLEESEFPVALRKNGEVLVASQQIGLFAFDLENVEKKSLEIYGNPCRFYVVDYIGSLHLLEDQREMGY